MNEAKEINAVYKEEHEERIKDLKVLLRTPEGKRWIWWLLGSCHMFSSTFTGNSSGNFMEGERNVALRVFADVLSINPKLMGQMASAHAVVRQRYSDLKKSMQGGK